MSQINEILPTKYRDCYVVDSENNADNNKSYRVKCILSPCKDSVSNKPFYVSNNTTSNLRRHLKVKDLILVS